ncbi:UV-endonuclease UvdE-domain-containing protein [Xylaria palmicola]|nr:UV-endonuclease UvdE-domain-containing protein [Xylaria palmicola]
MCGNTRYLIRCCRVGSSRRCRLTAPAWSYIPRPSISVCAHPPSLTMSPRRRKSNMALMDPEVSINEDSIPEPSTRGPRRSGRLSGKAGVALHAQPSGPEGDDLQTDPGRTKTKNGKKTAQSKAEMAISGLQAMDDRLRNNLKRQKLAVKESEVQSTGVDEATSAMMPRPTKDRPDVLPAEQEISGLKKGARKRDAKGMRDDEYDRIDGINGADTAEENRQSPEAGDAEPTIDESDLNVIKQEGARPPPVNSEYLPLPWKGRLGYACLNTYLRNSNPPVFSSRTCRISSIIEHRHPLQDPSLPEHATKNRPDKGQPAEIARGQKFVQELGLANARDIVKMIRWNDKYGIKFMRLSSEMFPFASHEEYGYKLAPFASEVLAEAGRVAGELGHRLTTHPGQFTQLGSPREKVVRDAVRDLGYHNEMLSLLKMPEQQDKDAVMILHMGGVFGDKAATLNRFRENYGKLSDEIKARLVLENDDVSWTVHDLLPVCEELNIPFVLDFHHHNIMFDKDRIREGTRDIVALFPRIRATWERKGITQKMHYSEPCPDAVTPRQRRKHRPRVMALPPCPDDMDLMIEAKDKEQSVFDLMRTYRLPGWDSFNDVVPYEREDENRPPPKTPKKKQRKKRGKAEVKEDAAEQEEEEPPKQQSPPKIPDEELGMGGPNNRVYWPIGMEEWLRPQKREVSKKRKAIDDGEGE